jgi:chromosome partitioning protein
MSRSLREVYSVLFLDCAPGISLLSENVLHAADAIIVPLLPTPLSVRMLMQLQDFTASKGWTDLMLLPFFSMVDRRKSLHHEIIAKTREQFPTLLATEVPYSSEIERMSVRRAPIPAFAPRSAAAQIYSALWAELMLSVWPRRSGFPCPRPAAALQARGPDSPSGFAGAPPANPLSHPVTNY